jgi:hypothetical protein
MRYSMTENINRRVFVVVLKGPRPGGPARRALPAEADLGPLREYAAETCRILLERLLSMEAGAIRKRRRGDRSEY